MTIADLKSYIESRFSCVIGSVGAKCQAGDRYVKIGREDASRIAGAPHFACQPGVIREGHPIEICTDEATAVRQTRAAFDDYAKNRSGTLYWRTLPQLERDDRDLRRCYVYLRLVISDKPMEF